MSYKKFTKDVGILSLTQVIAALSGIITLPIITKLLGVENYGIWIQLLVTLGLVSSIAIINLPYTLVRFLPGEKNKEEIQDGIWSVFIMVFVILIVISALLIFFSGVISLFLGCTQNFVLILSLIIIFECLNQIFYNTFRAFQEIKKYCFFTISQTIGQAVLILSAIILGYGLLGAVLSLLLIRIIIFLIAGAMVIKKVGVKIPKFLRIKEYLSFCLPLIPADTSSWIIQSSDKYFIGLFLGTIFVGYYAPAYTLGSFIAFFIMPLGFLLPATLSKHYDENKIDEVKVYLKYSLKYFLMIAIPAFFGLSALSRPLLSTFSTPEIAQHSYLVVPLVALGMLLSGIYAITNQIIILKKKTKISGAIWIVAAFLNFGLNFIFVPLFGILGAALTTLLAYAIITVLNWRYSFKELKFDIDWQFILKSLFASLLMALFVFWLKPVGLYKNIYAIISGVLIYGILIFSLRGFSKQEFQLFKNITKNS
ncbi:MAG: flippase [Candidatus Staskawiczbacteria bacterium]|nr:flippase [Candidatus Staskawiczbacteria bacterium]